MKITKTLALILLSILTVNAANAETGAAHKRAKSAKKAAAAKKEISSPKPKLGTSFKFDGSSLRGKYQSSLSTTATVENDKFLEDLLGGRTQFEDRSLKEKERN